MRLLGLAGFGLETVDEGLHVIAPGLLLLGHRRLQRAFLSALAGELVVGALVIGQLAVFEVQDAAHGAVQQAAVVADDQHRMGVFRQIAFQPERPFKVEVVGRLVQKQQVGLGKEHGSQRHAHPPATGEGGAGHLLLFVVETKPLQDRRCAAFGGPSVDIGQTGLDVSDAGRVFGGLALFHQPGAFNVGLQHRVDQRGLGRGHLLCDAADLGAGGQRDIAAVE